MVAKKQPLAFIPKPTNDPNLFRKDRHKMARRKTNDLENQMSLMDMMASESPEYTEEGPEELLDPDEDMEDSEGQTDKPFKLVANKTTKAKVSISTQALNVVKAVYADTV